MRYIGKIDQLGRLVVSDPSYEKGVWCRYDREFHSGSPWTAQLLIKDYKDSVEDYDFSGKEMILLLSKFGEKNELFDDGSFTMIMGTEFKEYQIGMDTACVAMGVNERAEEIDNCADDWQPDFALRTLTDGLFGTVNEGYTGDELRFILIQGDITDDSGYSEKDLLNYFVTQFEIEEITLVSDKDKSDIDEKLNSAQSSDRQPDLPGTDREPER